MTKQMTILMAAMMAGCGSAVTPPAPQTQVAGSRASYVEICREREKMSVAFCDCTADILVPAVTPTELSYMRSHNWRSSPAFDELRNAAIGVCAQ